MEKIRSIKRTVSVQKKRMVPEYYTVNEEQSVMIVEFTRNDLLSLQRSVSYGRPPNTDIMDELRQAWNGGWVNPSSSISDNKKIVDCSDWSSLYNPQAWRAEDQTEEIA